MVAMSRGSAKAERGRWPNPRLILLAVAGMALVLGIWSHRRSTSLSLLDFVVPESSNSSLAESVNISSERGATWSASATVASEIRGWNNSYASSLVLSKSTLAEGLAALDDWVRDPASKMFTITELPCASSPNEVAKAPSTVKRAIFYGMNNSGATRMRGEMMAAALNSLPDWSATCCGGSTKSWSWKAKGNFTQRLDLCVFVKYGKSGAQQFCKERGAVVLFDLLDNTKLFRNAIVYHDFGLFPDWPDVMIMPTSTTAKVMNEVFANNKTEVPKQLWPPYKVDQMATVLYHHQANPGVINPPTSMMKHGICRVAVLAGSSQTNLNPGTFDNLYKLVCSSKSVRYFSRVKQHQDKYTHVWLLHAYDFECQEYDLPPDPDCKPFEEMNHTTQAKLMEAGPKHGVPHKGHATAGTHDVDLSEAAREAGLGGRCFGDQWKHHIDPVLNLVDIALQWPPKLGVPPDWDLTRIVSLNRPTTRFLFWVSRGVPVLFGNFWGYMELAEAYDYKLPSGRIPSTKYATELPSMLKELADPRVRAYLRERGYSIAADHTLAREVDRLVEMYEEVLQRRRDCPACAAEFERLDRIRAEYAGTGRTPSPELFKGQDVKSTPNVTL